MSSRPPEELQDGVDEEDLINLSEIPSMPEEQMKKKESEEKDDEEIPINFSEMSLRSPPTEEDELEEACSFQPPDGEDYSSESSNDDLHEPRSLVCLLLGVYSNYASYFHASSARFFTSRCLSAPAVFEPGKLYNAQTYPGVPGLCFSELPERVRRAYTSRGEFVLTAGHYRTVLAGLLLERRLRDFQQSCARVLQLSPLIISVPTTGKKEYSTAVFCAESGDLLEVTVSASVRGRHRTELCCMPYGPLPVSLAVGYRLEHCRSEEATCLSTKALEHFFEGQKPVCNRHILDRIYGGFEDNVCPKLAGVPVVLMPLSNGREIVLDASLSAILQRYQTPASWPAFAVEIPPHPVAIENAKRLAPMMATNYEGCGIQLILSKTNRAAFDTVMSRSVNNWCTDYYKIVHLISAETELKHTDRPSPFSLAQQHTANNEAISRFKAKKTLYENESEEQRRVRLPELRQIYAEAWQAEAHVSYDIVLATVDLALRQVLAKDDDPDTIHHVRKQLQQRVKRIIINEAHLVTEAELNAILLSFADLEQIVVIGEPAAVPAFHTYNRKWPAELATCSAWDALVRKKNIPVEKLRPLSSVARFCPKRDEFELVARPPNPRSVLTLVNSGAVSRAELPVMYDLLDYAFKALKKAGLARFKLLAVEYDIDSDYYHPMHDTNHPIDYEVLTLESKYGSTGIVELTPRDGPGTFVFLALMIARDVADRQKDVIDLLKAETTMEKWNEMLLEKRFIDFGADFVDLADQRMEGEQTSSDHSDIEEDLIRFD